MSLNQTKIENIIKNHIDQFKSKLVYLGNKKTNYLSKKDSNKLLVFNSNNHLLLLDLNHSHVNLHNENYSCFIKIVLDVLYDDKLTVYVFSSILQNVSESLIKHDITMFIDNEIRLA